MEIKHRAHHGLEVGDHRHPLLWTANGGQARTLAMLTWRTAVTIAFTGRKFELLQEGPRSCNERRRLVVVSDPALTAMPTCGFPARWAPRAAKLCALSRPCPGRAVKIVRPWGAPP
jgi:hypothetical protein